MALPARILIADDHEVMRLGVRTLLAGNQDWVICGEAADGRQAVERVKDLAPDVIILDLAMPVMDGFQAANEIRRIAPNTKIVVFSIHRLPTTQQIINADAFVTKSTAMRELPAVLNRILQRDESISS